MKKKTIHIILIAFTILFLTADIIFLPKEVIVQIDRFGNPSNILPKYSAIAIPFVITIIGEILLLKNAGKKGKNIFLICIGFAVNIFTFIINIIK